ncbi:MAG TPA: hypothetical protein VHO70_20680 [Chitinispirillaceae bacterium]|nr:hypothetical protein [Chitinispirillaceae bacterium]
MNTVIKNDRSIIEPSINVPESPNNFHLKLKPYLHYRLEFLKPLLPHALYKYLISKNILTISDFYEMDLAQFLKQNDLNTQQVEQIKVLNRYFKKCRSRIIKVIKSHKMETYLPIIKYKDIAVLPDDILSALNQVLYSFFSISSDKKLKTVITKRFGIGRSTTTNHRKIGECIGLTRERSRQIKNECLADLAVLIDGGILKKPFSRCGQDYIECFGKYKPLCSPEFIIEKQTVFSRLTEKTVNHDSRYQKALFELLLEIWNVKTISLENKDYLINPAIPESLFFKTSIIIKNFLIENAVPCSKSKIAQAVKKETDNEASHDLTYALLEIMKDIKYKNDDLYEIDQRLIPKESVTEQIYRILLDKQKCMHYKDIRNELQKRYARSRDKFEGHIATMLIKMRCDRRLACIGKTGNWGLSEWNLNCNTISDLILQYLKTRKGPATTDEITSAVQRIRPHVKNQSMYALLNHHKNMFLRTHDGTFILKERESSSNTIYTGPVRTGLNLYHTIVKIFRENNFKPLYTKELHNALMKNNIIWTKRTTQERIRMCTYLIRHRVGSRIQISLDRKWKPPV